MRFVDLSPGSFGASDHRESGQRFAVRWNRLGIHVRVGVTLDGLTRGDIAGTMRHEVPRGFVLRDRDEEAAVLERARRRAGLAP